MEKALGPHHGKNDDAPAVETEKGANAEAKAAPKPKTYTAEENAEFVSALEAAIDTCGRLHAKPCCSLFFEKDPVDAINAVCERFDRKFVDPDYDPEVKWPLLAAPGSQHEEWKGQGQDWYNRYVDYSGSADMRGKGSWVRPGADAVVTDKVAPGDVIQGGIGNCWMCSIFASIASHPDLISESINPKKNSLWGVYSARLYIDGTPVYGVVDDRFFTNASGNHHDVHSKTENELWVAILAKVVAKWASWIDINGADAGGFCVKNIMVACSGAKSFHDYQWAEHGKKSNGVDIKEATVEARKIFKAGCIAVTEAWNLGFKHQNKTNLVSEHAYSILWFGKVGGKEMIQLRNPHGAGGEFKGAWADGSKEWDANPNVVRDLQKQSKPYSPGNDGVFFMEFNDFMKNFWRVMYVGPLSSFRGNRPGETPPPDCKTKGLFTKYKRKEKRMYYQPKNLGGDSKLADEAYQLSGGGNLGDESYHMIMGKPDGKERQAEFDRLKAENWGKDE